MEFKEILATPFSYLGFGSGKNTLPPSYCPVSAKVTGSATPIFQNKGQKSSSNTMGYALASLGVGLITTSLVGLYIAKRNSDKSNAEVKRLKAEQAKTKAAINAALAEQEEQRRIEQEEQRRIDRERIEQAARETNFHTIFNAADEDPIMSRRIFLPERNRRANARLSDCSRAVKLR